MWLMLMINQCFPPSIRTVQPHFFTLSVHEIGDGNYRKTSHCSRITSLRASSYRLFHKMDWSLGILIGMWSRSYPIYLGKCDMQVWSSKRKSHQQWVTIHKHWVLNFLQRVERQAELFHSTASPSQRSGWIFQQYYHENIKEKTI